MNKKITVLIITIIMSLSLTACGNGMSYSDNGFVSASSTSESSKSYTDSMSGIATNGISMSDSGSGNYNDYADIETETGIEMTTTSEKDNDNSNVDSNNNVNSSNELYEEKLVYHSNVEIETKDYDNAYKSLKDLISKYNGIIESEQFYNNNGSYLYDYGYNSYSGNQVQRELDLLVRIPTENFDAFNEENEANGNVVSKSSSVQNITQNYYDTTASLEGLKIQLSRLQEIMSYTTDVEDLITLNREISTLENQINSMTTEIRTMDIDVAYSYVYINLKEVVEYTEETPVVKKSTFLDRLKNTLVDTWSDLLKFLENLLFLIIRLIPYIIVIGIIVITIRLIYKTRKVIRKKQGKNTNPSLFDLHNMVKSEIQQQTNVQQPEVQQQTENNTTDDKPMSGDIKND